MAPAPLAAASDWLEFLPDPLKGAATHLARGRAQADLPGMQEHLENLCALASCHGGLGTVETAISSVAITISPQTTAPAIGMFNPRFCLVLQGAKEVTIGERRMRYDPNNYFIASLEVPASGCVIEASADRPLHRPQHGARFRRARRAADRCAWCAPTMTALASPSAPSAPIFSIPGCGLCGCWIRRVIFRFLHR